MKNKSLRNRCQSVSCIPVIVMLGVGVLATSCDREETPAPEPPRKKPRPAMASYKPEPASVTAARNRFNADESASLRELHTGLDPFISLCESAGCP